MLIRKFQTRIIRNIRRFFTMYCFVGCILILPAVLFYFSSIPFLVGFPIGFFLFGLTDKFKLFKLIWKTLPRDLTALYHVVCSELMIKRMILNKTLISDLLIRNAEKQPNSLAYKDAETDECLSFLEANNLSNQVANHFYSLGYRKGDTVCLLMENRIEYLPIWLGLSKIGVITALINTNLREDSLRHCIDVSECKALLFSEIFESVVASSRGLFRTSFSFYCYGKSKLDGVPDVKEVVINGNKYEPPKPSNLSLTDKLIYIYTSGTTGLPKAAIIRGTRFAFMGATVGKMLHINDKDRCYGTLPLYHSNGGIVLAGSALFGRCCLVVRKKFSASKFFEDCVRNNCSIFNYIGETCRYMLATSKSRYDTTHKIRACMGNGLRPSIWKEFQARFNIPLICEFYGATEGNASVVNFVGKPGAVGFNSVLVPWAIPMKLVKRDEVTGEILRRSDGLAQIASIGESGELVAKIRSEATKQFDGYLNKQATQKKIVYDVFSKGDSAFLSGDILIQDEEGFFYFQDRTGDTFRWKGENVSTNEVEGVISKSLHLNDVCVYGVEINGIEGKAGMACIVDPERKVNMKTFYSTISTSLPPYARPVFIRLADEVAKTSTFKFQKNILCKEGYNPLDCRKGDHLFYFDGSEKNYVQFQNDTYEKICEQKIKF